MYHVEPRLPFRLKTLIFRYHLLSLWIFTSRITAPLEGSLDV